MVESDGAQDAFARFNVFRALRLGRHEIRHSNFLSWLLDPSESHGQHDLFLRGFVGLAESSVSKEGTSDAPTSDVSNLLDGVQVDREHDALDLRIVLPGRRQVIAVENKLFSSEQSDQLGRYAESVRASFPDWRHTFLYLTLDGETPSDERWLPLSHRQVMETIAKSQGQLRRDTPPAIRAFVQHYIDLLSDIYAQRDRLSKRPRLPENLQAIGAAVLEHEHEDWAVVSDSSTIVECGPRSLFEALPPIGTKRGRDPRQWLTLRFQDHGTQGYVGRYWRPSSVSDLALRNAVLRSLLEERQQTGFKYKNGSTDDALSRESPAFSGDRIQDLRTGRVPEDDDLRALVNRELSSVDIRLRDIQRIVREAVAKHRAQE